MKRFIVALLLVVLLTLGIAVTTSAQHVEQKNAPDVLDLDRVGLRIVDVFYAKELKGVNASYEQKSPEKYRAILVTVEVTKPAGEELTLYAQDFSLHYYYTDEGETESDIAPCQGISVYSTSLKVDRPLYLSRQGRKSSTTGTASTKEETIYVDLFFDYFEPTTSEIYLMVARPVVAPFKTEGWQ